VSVDEIEEKKRWECTSLATLLMMTAVATLLIAVVFTWKGFGLIQSWKMRYGCNQGWG
jgi:hypothetical protein